MQTFFSNDHRLRNPETELYGGRLVTPYESPDRVDLVSTAIARARLGDRVPVENRDLSVAGQVHDAGYLRFLSTCWADWQAAGHDGELISYVWPGRRMPSERIPTTIAGKVGYYALSADTAISGGTFEAAVSSQSVALAAADAVLSGAKAAFGLCRPPGHHAARDQYGGYCFINNAAVAAQHALNEGRQRVAILDVDFHHGNGTQDIFYERDDVLFVSLHGDPMHAFPHFLGFADEQGRGVGQGCNLNLPLAPGTDYREWSQALDRGLSAIRAFSPQLLVVSLGVDAYEEDPISFFKLNGHDFADCGKRIGRLGLDTVFLMEGGYAIDSIGDNVVSVLGGFEDAGSQRAG
ncbi:MAG: histone deacetylase family protein [Pseudomonadota bacterium]